MIYFSPAALAWRQQVAFSFWFPSHVFWHCCPSTATWSSSTTFLPASTVCRWVSHLLRLTTNLWHNNTPLVGRGLTSMHTELVRENWFKYTYNNLLCMITGQEEELTHQWLHVYRRKNLREKMKQNLTFTFICINVLILKCWFQFFLLFLSSNPRVLLFSSSASSLTRKQGTPWNTAAAASALIIWSNQKLLWVPSLNSEISNIESSLSKSLCRTFLTLLNFNWHYVSPG